LRNGSTIPLVRPDGRSTTIDGEVGYRTPGLGATVDINAGLTNVRTRLDDFTTGNIAFDNDSTRSLRGRLGARLAWAGDLAPFVDGKVYHEFNGDSDVGIASGSFSDSIEGRGRGTWGRNEAGLGGRILASGWRRARLGRARGFPLLAKTVGAASRPPPQPTRRRAERPGGPALSLSTAQRVTAPRP
jgi:hypothetical protein